MWSLRSKVRGETCKSVHQSIHPGRHLLTRLGACQGALLSPWNRSSEYDYRMWHTCWQYVVAPVKVNTTNTTKTPPRTLYFSVPQPLLSLGWHDKTLSSPSFSMIMQWVLSYHLSIPCLMSRVHFSRTCTKTNKLKPTLVILRIRKLVQLNFFRSYFTRKMYGRVSK